ncbi:MAG: BCD family MFS transporter [Anaerolineae bacterium]|jgi:BCD family chlorophyll transporter-like MFS transporter|nr:BCD family MFS transporter [Anaerolineae bacterium]
MKYIVLFFRFLLGVVKTLRLALPKMGVGWMFALLTINFNRITIVELNVAAVAVTAMLAMHYFLSPFQVIAGRIADRHPIFGLRRTPYLLLSSFTGSLVFLLLPTVALNMSTGSPLAYLFGFGVMALFGVTIAVMGDSHHSLIAEAVTPRTRGAVISVVWTFTILSTILSAVVMNKVMPEYSPAAMQNLYNLTPFIVIGCTFLGILGMEKRLTGPELAAALEKARLAAPQGTPLKAAVTVLRENRQAWAFFTFVFVSIFSIFLQDNILEPFGAEVFGMSVAETTKFQPAWGGGVLIGMLLIGIVSAVFSISKRNIALVGCGGTAFGMGILALAALTRQEQMVKPALMFMGFFTGFFNVGALSMMMDMTVEGATGLYMGLWGMAQAFGNGAASFGGGLLHTLFIETGIMTPATAYSAIFGLEAAGMVVAGLILWGLSVKTFQATATLRRGDALRAMEAGAGA